MSGPGVSVRLYIGEFGDRTEEVMVPVSESLMRELREPVELSDEPFSVLLASPGMWGGKGDAVTMRKKKFEMRRAVAKDIGRAVEQFLIDRLGDADKIDGYSKGDLDPDDRALRRVRQS